MLKTYTLAELAPDLDHAEVVSIHIAPGDSLAEDDDLLDIVTDKATITIPVPASGTVVMIHCPPAGRLHAADSVVTLELTA